QLRADKRNVSIVAGPHNTLTLVDPWTPQMHTLSQHSSGHAQVAQADGSTDAEAMWIIEDGKLTQRGFDGTLLLSLGSDVSEFQQNLLQGALRVAFTDGGRVFEAKAPGFVPMLVAEDACHPSYNGSSLDLHTPCSAQQLVRINLVNAEITRFTAGVYRAYAQGVANFELVFAADGSTEVWIATPTTRTQMVPTPYDAISVLDATHIAGRTGDGVFGIWDLAAKFTPAFTGVASIQAFRDSRTSRLLWLMQYQIEEGRGTLAGFDQSELERLVAGTQPTLSTVLASQVLQGGYSVFLPTILPEPMVLTLEAPIAQQADKSFSGQLNARLLSGSLASRIDDGVSSSLLALAPYPGILYGILEGPRSGLWFAAL
ncbi:MAG: hypothetical protein JWN04_4231, partial [Myxococcaceae bacterium]|nr:hypothetical protein [Myxococcaceae bacterium]